ncbi:hypothetical protein [Pseudonocardia sp. EC080625-04]|uniref:hypothetical protein n=1 Tax=Pseudonocardia sp. EC080625-04 TaxID=1096868 RepID=UPI0009E86B2B|nr:hypothetical protein [Pseudonocardia sp. EC080625-04]
MSDLERIHSQPTQALAPAAVGDGLLQFQDLLLGQIQHLGLPAEGVLVSPIERQRALKNVDDALSELSADDRARAVYVSKMIAAAAVGLFDAALNYLWDETVSELRRRVAGFDLKYFFDIAVTSPDRRKRLSSVEDLVEVNDIDLIRACNEIGLLDRVAATELNHIRFMRNHASAAHPNQASITGLQLATWLETCVRYVLTLSYDQITAETGRLLANVRSDRIDHARVDEITAFFDDLDDRRAQSLAAGLFGLYVDADRSPIVADNVRVLWPEIWPLLDDETRYGFGNRYGRFAANADQEQAGYSRELIDLVDGQSYLPEQVRQIEIDKAVDGLMVAHQGFDNFHIEPSAARTLRELVGDGGDVPKGVAAKYAKAVTRTFIGNGYGVSRGAVGYYREMIETFSSTQASISLRAFRSPEVSSALRSSTGEAQWNELLDLLEPKLTSRRSRDLLEAIREFSATPDKLGSDSGIQRLLEAFKG